MQKNKRETRKWCREDGHEVAVIKFHVQVYYRLSDMMEAHLP